MVPLPFRQQMLPQVVGRSQGYFPLVGLLLGATLLGLDRLLGLALPSFVVNTLLVIALLLLTGALHIDGFADTCDGLGGRRSPQERREIMHDSRVGGFGVAGVCCLLILKVVSLAGVPEGSRMAALLLMPVMGRWAIVYAVFAYPYARAHGLGKIFKETAGWRSLIMATLITLVIAICFAEIGGLVILVAVWIIVVVIASYLRRKFGGLTGDTYGAINEVAEVAVLLVISIFATHGPWLMSCLPW